MAKTASIDSILNKKEVSVPIWALMAVVERDYEAWEISDNIISGDELMEEEYDRPEFPDLDSTTKILEVLEAQGIKFKGGKWR